MRRSSQGSTCIGAHRPCQARVVPVAGSVGAICADMPTGWKRRADPIGGRVMAEWLRILAAR
jgi:hypothetical protein